MVTKERGEELALFLDMRRREMDADELHTPSPSESMPPRKTRADEFLNSENDKSDYDWLLTPPGTPLFPPLEKDSQKPVLSQIEIPNARPTAPKSRLDKVQEEPASRSIIVPKQPTLSSRQNSSSNGNRRSSSSMGLTSATSRPATPTGRPTLPSKTKPSRSSTPVSHPTLPSKTKPSRSSTPPMVRSSTPTRSTARSSTPTARPSLPTSKSQTRSATPNRGPSAPSVEPSLSAPPGRSSSAPKSGPTISKKPLLSRGSSPPVKSRPWKPSEIPGFSLDAPPNLRTSFPERPVSASKGRPGAPSARSSSIDSISNGKSRQQSSSPSRGRASHGSAYGNGKAILAKSRSRGKDNETDSPVLIGTKMVERVVNMRKLPPPKQDDGYSTHNEGSKSLSTNSSGFGRTLSNKSLDMALRHMDIRRSIPGKPRPSMTNIPASSVYSVRSSSTKKTVSAADSPLATSSNASSEPSIKNSSVSLDGSEIEDNDFGRDKGNSSPASEHGKH
ncbi:uncharacterized protein LOC132192037 [Corylus avellana]|uniref:uncharacterized protein LOC132192037 n=1 Tax=Corylus avellana TaxID=13451 RepID=UPI00286C76F4|nr:uncharacterized protein LOC132192037 [Corylus avellana]